MELYGKMYAVSGDREQLHRYQTGDIPSPQEQEECDYPSASSVSWVWYITQNLDIGMLTEK